MARIAVAPDDRPDWIVRAVEEGGAEVVPLERAEALVWTSHRRAGELADRVAGAPWLRWVQLPWAGVEEFAGAGLFGLQGDGPRTWTCGKGVYAEPVAEHALALVLAGLRGLPARALATSWGAQWGRTLYGGRVTILGAGGIADSLIRLLEPLRVEVTVVRRGAEPVPGAARTLPADRLHQAL
ncbi:MAG TPA: hypothetical protein VFO65_11250, partial [Acidimicrobiales bacterium]|nr:hypothetical protein [Acidimicrobiales bacterium]